MAKALNEKTYKFLVEYYDTQAAFTRQYYLSYFILDSTIEMFDIKNSRIFLKRTLYDGICLDDLYAGAQVTIYGRQMKVISFADEFTSTRLGSQKAKNIVLLNQNILVNLGRILDGLASKNIRVAEVKPTKLTASQISQYSQGDAKFADAPVCALELLGANSIDALKSLVPPDQYVELDASAHALIFESADVAALGAEIDKVEGNTSICVIKPHCFLQGLSGAIIGCLNQAGLTVAAAQTFSLDRQAATEWLDVYQDVYPEYNSTIEHFCTGPSLVLKVSGEGAFLKLREICGPIDPVVAQRIAPNSLRAQFGMDKVKNAVHCTDLIEDVILESQFFYKTINDSVACKNQKW